MLKRTTAKIFVGLLLSIGCAAEGSRSSPPAPPSTSTTQIPSSVTAANPPLTWSDSIEATEVAGIRASEGKATRVGRELRIQLLNGRTVVFKDDTSARLISPAQRYAGYVKALHSHVVHLVPYEGTGPYLLVDDSTGESTKIWGAPVPSPDGKRFVLTSMAGEEDTDPSVIEIWRMMGRQPEIEFRYDTDKEPWEPSDAVWRDSTTIDFIKNSHSDPSEPYVRTPGRLIRSDTTWIAADVTTSSTPDFRATIVAASSTPSASVAPNMREDTAPSVHFSSPRDSVCGELAENGLKIPNTRRTAVRATRSTRQCEEGTGTQPQQAGPDGHHRGRVLSGHTP